LTRSRYVVAALAAVSVVLMLGLLTVQLITIERQREIAARQEQRVIALLEAGRPQARELREAVPALSGGLRRADDLVKALARQDAPAALAAAGELATDLVTGDRARILADRGNDLLAQLQSGDTVGDVEATTRAVLDLLAVTQGLRAIAAQTGTDVDTLTDATLAFQSETLGIQRETLATLQRSLEIQAETLERVRNIDRRTGALVPQPVEELADEGDGVP
jgi:hypothetical protein